MPLTPEQRKINRQEAVKRYYVRHKDRCIASRMRTKERAGVHKVSKWNREGHLRNKYGIGLKEFEALVDSQNGLCAICGKDAKLYVDHDHNLGHVRGLLCQKCNVIVGSSDESVYILEQAKEYVKRGGITCVLGSKGKKS